MPDHIGVGQLPVERGVVVFAAVPDIEPISMRRKEVEHLWTGNEVSQDAQRHRLAIHLEMVSACSLRAPGVVK